MQRGAVVETGTHAQLQSRQGGAYATLVQLQQQRHAQADEEDQVYMQYMHISIYVLMRSAHCPFTFDQAPSERRCVKRKQISVARPTGINLSEA